MKVENTPEEYHCDLELLSWSEPWLAKGVQKNGSLFTKNPLSANPGGLQSPHAFCFLK